MSNARKLFRVLKSLLEYKKINAILGKADSLALHKLILQLVPRVAFFFYWIFDTFLVLAKIKVLPNIDLKKITYRWAACWTVANLTSLLGAIIEIVEMSGEITRIQLKKRQLSVMTAQMNQTKSLTNNQKDDGSNAKYTLENFSKQEKQLDKLRFAQILIAIKSCGDSITSTSGLGWPKKYLGYEFNDGLIGLGGLTSAVISCYQIYPTAKK